MPRIRLDANCIVAAVNGGYIVERHWWQAGESGEIDHHSSLHSCASLEGALDIVRRHIIWLDGEMAVGFELRNEDCDPPGVESLTDGG